MKRLHVLGVSGGLLVVGTVGWLVRLPTSQVDALPLPVESSSLVGPAVVGEPSAGPAPVEAPAPAPAAAGAAGPALDAGWVQRTAAAAGLSEVALTAYARASLTAPSSCHLGWTTLAGIGWVESENGTLGGRVVEPDGRPSTPIIGPALSGGRFAAVPATARSTALHGDPTWDHAVGPLQFLPSTWETWGRDGDGDGALDPQDINDAAAAAAAYLCGTDDDLTTGTGWAAAIFAYNHSDAYVQTVYTAASTYATRTG